MRSSNVCKGSQLTVRWAAVWQESIENGRKGRWHPLGQVGNSALGAIVRVRACAGSLASIHGRRGCRAEGEGVAECAPLSMAAQSMRANTATSMLIATAPIAGVRIASGGADTR